MASTKSNKFNTLATQYRPEYLAQLEHFLKCERELQSLGFKHADPIKYETLIDQLKNRIETDCHEVVYLNEAVALRKFVKKEKVKPRGVSR